MAMNYHHNSQEIAQKLRNAHNPRVCIIRKDFFDAEFSFLKKHIQDKHVLIAGSWLGHDSFALAEYCKYITGIELIQTFVNEANQNLQKTKYTNISFIQWDFLDLDYPDDSFDIAILNMWTIGNFDDKEQVISAISRIAPKFFFWFREPVERDLPIRLQMYEEEWGKFQIDWTTIREVWFWLESRCTTRKEICDIAKDIWVKVKFHKVFLSYTMAEIIKM